MTVRVRHIPHSILHTKPRIPFPHRSPPPPPLVLPRQKCRNRHGLARTRQDTRRANPPAFETNNQFVDGQTLPTFLRLYRTSCPFPPARYIDPSSRSSHSRLRNSY